MVLPLCTPGLRPCNLKEFGLFFLAYFLFFNFFHFSFTCIKSFAFHCILWILLLSIFAKTECMMAQQSFFLSGFWCKISTRFYFRDQLNWQHNVSKLTASILPYDLACCQSFALLGTWPSTQMQVLVGVSNLRDGCILGWTSTFEQLELWSTC